MGKVEHMHVYMYVFTHEEINMGWHCCRLICPLHNLGRRQFIEYGAHRFWQTCQEESPRDPAVSISTVLGSQVSTNVSSFFI